MATQQELEAALVKADAAGNADDARAFANEIRRLRAATPPAGVTSRAESSSAPQASSDSDAASAPTERTLTQSIGRELGLGARGLIQGAYGLSGMLGGDVAAAAEAKARDIPYRSSREAGADLADTIGLPRPETGTERVGGDITEALAGSGGLMGVGRQLAVRLPGALETVASRVGNMLASLPGTQVASAVGSSGGAGVTREAGGGQGAQLAAGLAGGLTPSFGRAAVEGAARRVVRGGEAGRQHYNQTVRDFESLGAQPSVGQATQSFGIRGAENLLAGGPTSSGVMTRAAERQADDLGAGLRRIADDFNPSASGERAGRAVEKGVDQFVRNVNATRRALYWDADRHIPTTTQVPLTNTQQALANLTALTPGAESTTAALVNPKINALAQTIGEDLMAAKAARATGIPYSAVKDIRSRIGEELSEFTLSTDKPTAQYKQLYAALSRDMEGAARAQGPAAMQAAKRANNYFKASADRISQLERVVDKSGGPEKVFNAVMSGTRDGGTTLRTVMQSLPKEGQRALTGAVIKRMGLANPGAQGVEGESFSAQTFLTNWNRVSPEAKRALFDRHGPKFVESMNKIARVASNIREGSKVFANPSGTANRAAAYTFLGTLGALTATGQIGAAATLAASGASANVLARALNNPTVVAWLGRSTEVPMASAPQMIVALKSAAERSGDEDAQEIAQLLSQQEVEKPSNTTQP